MVPDDHHLNGDGSVLLQTPVMPCCAFMQRSIMSINAINLSREQTSIVETEGKRLIHHEPKRVASSERLKVGRCHYYTIVRALRT